MIKIIILEYNALSDYKTLSSSYVIVLFIIPMCGVGDDKKKHNGSYMQHIYGQIQF